MSDTKAVHQPPTPTTKKWKPPATGPQQPLVELVKTSLGQHGHTMLIGLEDERQLLHFSFSFRPWRGIEEKQIDQLLAEKKYAKYADHNGKQATLVLSHMLATWGQHNDFASYDTEKRIMILERSWMADVLYAWICLRVDALGGTMGIGHTCPRCAHEWTWHTSLDGVEIDIVPKKSIPRYTYKLRSALTVGKEEYTLVCLEPPKWHAVSNMARKTMERGTGLKLSLMRDALYGLAQEGADRDPMGIPVTAFDMMVKRDLEGIIAFIDGSFPQPDLSMNPECPQCDLDWTTGTQWAYSFFFGPSSLLPEGTT